MAIRRLSILFALPFLFLSAASPAAAASSLRGTTWGDLSFAGGEWHYGLGLRVDGLFAPDEAWSFIIRGHLGLWDGESEAEIQRAYLEYSSGAVRLRLGRQAVAWGIGWFFRPTDLITPRVFLAEEEERPGKDLLFLGIATSDLGGLEFAAGERLFGLRSGFVIGRSELRLLGLREGEVKTLGFDLQGGLAGLYMEAAYAWTADPAAGRPALLLGWKRAVGEGRLFYAEYLHDERGRLFPRRNYFALGLKIPRDELTEYTLAALASLDDGGITASGLVNLVLSDRADLQAGAGVVLGPENTDFALAAAGTRFNLSATLKYYF